MSELSALGKKLRAKAKPEWQPLDLTTLREGVWLAADPSFSAFGLVLFEHSAARGPMVHLAATFKGECDEDAVGHEANLQRAETLEIKLRAWAQQWLLAPRDWGDVHLVHEGPPVGGGKLRDADVTLLAGYAFRRAFREYPRVPMVQKQSHAGLICGDRHATKTVEHAELKKLYDGILTAGEWVTNAATRDALCVALTAAKRGFSSG